MPQIHYRRVGKLGDLDKQVTDVVNDRVSFIVQEVPRRNGDSAVRDFVAEVHNPFPRLLQHLGQSFFQRNLVGKSQLDRGIALHAPSLQIVPVDDEVESVRVGQMLDHLFKRLALDVHRDAPLQGAKQQGVRSGGSGLGAPFAGENLQPIVGVLDLFVPRDFGLLDILQGAAAYIIESLARFLGLPVLALVIENIHQPAGGSVLRVDHDDLLQHVDGSTQITVFAVLQGLLHQDINLSSAVLLDLTKAPSPILLNLPTRFRDFPLVIESLLGANELGQGLPLATEVLVFGDRIRKLLSRFHNLRSPNQRPVGLVKSLLKDMIADRALGIAILSHHALPVDRVLASNPLDERSGPGPGNVLGVLAGDGQPIHRLRITGHQTQGLLVSLFRVRIASRAHQVVGLTR